MDSPSSRPSQYKIRQRHHLYSGPFTMDNNEGTKPEGGVDRAGGHIDRYHSPSTDRFSDMRTSGPPISRHYWQYLCTTPRGIKGRRSGTATIYTRNSPNPAPTGESGNNRKILQGDAADTPAARVGDTTTHAPDLAGYPESTTQAQTLSIVSESEQPQLV